MKKYINSTTIVSCVLAGVILIVLHKFLVRKTIVIDAEGGGVIETNFGPGKAA